MINTIKSAIIFVADKQNFISVHAVNLFITTGVLIHSYLWAGEYAYTALTASISGAEVALTVGAVTAPVSLLAKYVFDIYSIARREAMQLRMTLETRKLEAEIQKASK